MRHIVALSGGKDSTAMALLLRESEPEANFEYICNATGDELPEMFAHWRKLSAMLGKPIIPVTGGRTLNGLVQIQKAIPNFRQRWCTRMIKIEPSKQYYFNAAPCVAYVGLRADEEAREGIYGAIEGVTQRFPLRERGWGIKEVWRFLDERGVTIPRRTDCARCFYQELWEWWELWKTQPDVWADAEAQEESTGHTWRSPGRDTWPTALKDLRAAFEAGKRPVIRAKKGVRRRSIAGQMDVFGMRDEMCRACTL